MLETLPTSTASSRLMTIDQIIKEYIEELALWKTEAQHYVWNHAAKSSTIQHLPLCAIWMNQRTYDMLFYIGIALLLNGALGLTFMAFFAIIV